MEYPEFNGKTAIATGAASGMALLFLQKMAEQGANVVLTDVNEDAVQAAAGEIRRKGGSAVGVKVDVRKYEEIQNAADIAMEKFGRIDYLMNSAGGCSQRVCKQSGGFVNASPESIEWGVDVNLKGAVLFVRAVLGRMFEQNYGVIINMGSIDGVSGGACLDYTASKCGMIGLSQGIANYGAEHGVRSVCISPGPVLTRVLDCPMIHARSVPALITLYSFFSRTSSGFSVCGSYSAVFSATFPGDSATT